MKEDLSYRIFSWILKHPIETFVLTIGALSLPFIIGGFFEPGIWDLTWSDLK